MEELSDEAVLKELGSRVARYRLNNNLTQAALAKEAGVSQRTLIRIEHGEATQTPHLIRILRTLGLLENLENLIPEPAISPIQQLKLQGKRRQRASSKAKKTRTRKSGPQKIDLQNTGPQEPWSWGDDE